MCGSYELKLKEQEKLAKLIQKFCPSLDVTIENYYPAMLSPIIMQSEHQLQIKPMNWGFKTEQGIVYNARIETVQDKPLFKDHYFNHRCVIITTGFHEYSEHKNRYMVKREGSDVTYLKGFYRQEANEYFFIILTQPAASNLAMIHSRMPLLLQRDEIMDWLNGGDGQNQHPLEIHLDSSYETLSLFD